MLPSTIAQPNHPLSEIILTGQIKNPLSNLCHDRETHGVCTRHTHIRLFGLHLSRKCYEYFGNFCHQELALSVSDSSFVYTSQVSSTIRTVLKFGLKLCRRPFRQIILDFDKYMLKYLGCPTRSITCDVIHVVPSFSNGREE